MNKLMKKMVISMMILVLVITCIPSSVMAVESQDGTIQEVSMQVEKTNVPNVISAGDTFQFEFTVRKDGNANMDVNHIYVDFETSEGLNIMSSSNRMRLTNFDNNGSNTYQVNFELNPDVVGGKQTISMNFVYKYNLDGSTKEGSNSAKVRIPVNGLQSPTISMLDQNHTKNALPGEKVNLSYTLMNNSSKYAISKLSVSYVPTEGLKSLQDMDNYQVDSLTAGGTDKKSISFQVASGATGKQTITFSYKFDYTIHNQVFHAEGTDIVTVDIGTTQANSNIPYVVLDSVNYGDVVKSGEEFNVKLRFKNSSDRYQIENITITEETTDGLVSQDSSNKIFITKLKASGSKTKTLRLKMKEDIASGYQTVTFHIKYGYVIDGKRVEAETTEQANIEVKGSGDGKDKTTVATPYMMVKAYDYGEKVAAGSRFNLHLEIQNTSETVKMENIVVSMETAGDISIASASNTYYIKKMNVGEVEIKDIEMQALASAKAMSSTITLNFKYEYLDKNTRTQVTSTEQISIPIFQPDRLTFELVPVLDGVMAGNETSLSVQYVNKGKGTVYNVSAEMIGNVDCAEPVQNLGNFEPGGNGTIDYYVTPQETGEVSGQITIKYEDENMEEKIVELPYSFVVEENVPIEDYYEEDTDVSQDDKGNAKAKKMALIVGGILVFIVVLGVFVIIMKRRKRAKLLRIQALEDMSEDGEE